MSRRAQCDDTDAFMAFLRSHEGVRVDVTATVIRVSQKRTPLLRRRFWFDRLYHYTRS